MVTDPDESIEGWVPTDDGAFIVGEPQGSPGWYPVNDNPQDFLPILRHWAAQHRYGNVTTAQFTALAERDSGRNLDQFFRVWLYQPEKPTSW